MHASIDPAGGQTQPPDFAPRYPPERVLTLRRHIVTPGRDRWQVVSVGTAPPPPTISHAELHRVLRALNAMTACAGRLQAERDEWATRCHGALALAAAAGEREQEAVAVAADRVQASTDDARALVAGFRWLFWCLGALVLVKAAWLGWCGAVALGWLG